MDLSLWPLINLLPSKLSEKFLHLFCVTNQTSENTSRINTDVANKANIFSYFTYLFLDVLQLYFFISPIYVYLHSCYFTFYFIKCCISSCLDFLVLAAIISEINCFQLGILFCCLLFLLLLPSFASIFGSFPLPPFYIFCLDTLYTPWSLYADPAPNGISGTDKTFFLLHYS